MNYKLEKFWNSIKSQLKSLIGCMNYKLEKFWNEWYNFPDFSGNKWTINLKSFEIQGHLLLYVFCYNEL